MSYKNLYQHFLQKHGDVLHMASHSHHFWPDCTREATLQYWDDTARYSDKKWDLIFSSKIPQLQKYVAKHLGISRPDHLVFAPNTHDLVIRLLSTLDFKNKPKILTTDGEFHSFSRQVRRLEEEKCVEVTRIASYPNSNFLSEFKNALEKNSYDLIFISHVFFNSGTSIGDLNEIVKFAHKHGKIVIDGYHSYFALPINLKEIEDRIYFMAGHYKYAQGGEGLCFMSVPPGEDRPLITGWFAEFEALASKSGEVTYPRHAGRYLGSTMDFTPLYRALSVYELFEEKNISVAIIHQHIQKLQDRFLQIINELKHPLINSKNLLTNGKDLQGHFLAFDLKDVAICQEVSKHLTGAGILTDARGAILRFGFGLYQDIEDLERLRRIKEF